MYRQGKIYADSRNNAVFPRENGGAYLRGTSDKAYFHAIGNKTQGAYVIEGIGDVWLCESPIDAISIKAHAPDAHVIAFGGNMLKLSDFTIPSEREIITAFDSDAQGRKFAEEVIKLWPTAKAMKAPSGKDWNEALQNDTGLIDANWIVDDGGGNTKTSKRRLVL